jgi:hypothetical protein
MSDDQPAASMTRTAQPTRLPVPSWPSASRHFISQTMTTLCTVLPAVTETRRGALHTAIPLLYSGLRPVAE